MPAHNGKEKDVVPLCRLLQLDPVGQGAQVVAQLHTRVSSKRRIAIPAYMWNTCRLYSRKDDPLRGRLAC